MGLIHADTEFLSHDSSCIAFKSHGVVSVVDTLSGSDNASMGRVYHNWEYNLSSSDTGIFFTLNEEGREQNG